MEFFGFSNPLHRRGSDAPSPVALFGSTGLSRGGAGAGKVRWES
jgi:hypothetical protein